MKNKTVFCINAVNGTLAMGFHTFFEILFRVSNEIYKLVDGCFQVLSAKL